MWKSTVISFRIHTNVCATHHEKKSNKYKNLFHKKADKLIRFLTSELHAIVNRKILNCPLWHGIWTRRWSSLCTFCRRILFLFAIHSHSPPIWNINASHRQHTHTNGGSGFSVDFEPIFKHIIKANIPFIQSRIWFFRFFFFCFFLNTPTPLLRCAPCEEGRERRRARECGQTAPAEMREGWIAMRLGSSILICINITTPLPTSTSTTKQSRNESKGTSVVRKYFGQSIEKFSFYWWCYHSIWQHHSEIEESCHSIGMGWMASQA